MDKILNLFTAAVLYLVIVIFTFGHAYVHFPNTEEHWFAGEPYTVHNGTGFKVFGSLVCGLSWPLYWSVEIQK